jgi:hypothetical protein
MSSAIMVDVVAGGAGPAPATEAPGTGAAPGAGAGASEAKAKGVQFGRVLARAVGARALAGRGVAGSECGRAGEAEVKGEAGGEAEPVGAMAGDAPRATGAAMAGVSPVAGAAMAGAAMAGVSPVAGAAMAGASMAGVSPVAGAAMAGASMAGASPVAGAAMAGASMAGASPVAGASMAGASMAGASMAGASMAGASPVVAVTRAGPGAAGVAPDGAAREGGVPGPAAFEVPARSAATGRGPVGASGPGTPDGSGESGPAGGSREPGVWRSGSGEAASAGVAPGAVVGAGGPTGLDGRGKAARAGPEGLAVLERVEGPESPARLEGGEAKVPRVAGGGNGAASAAAATPRAAVSASRPTAVPGPEPNVPGAAGAVPVNPGTFVAGVGQVLRPQGPVVDGVKAGAVVAPEAGALESHPAPDVTGGVAVTTGTGSAVAAAGAGEAAVADGRGTSERQGIREARAASGEPKRHEPHVHELDGLRKVAPDVVGPVRKELGAAPASRADGRAAAEVPAMEVPPGLKPAARPAAAMSGSGTAPSEAVAEVAAPDMGRAAARPSEGARAGGGPEGAPGSIAERVTDYAVRFARLSGSRDGNSTEVRMYLEPPSLGELRVRLTASGGVVHAELVVRDRAAQAVVESGLPQLREALAGHGVRAGSLTVSVDAGGTGGTGGGAGFGGNAEAPWRPAYQDGVRAAQRGWAPSSRPAGGAPARRPLPPWSSFEYIA